MICVELRLLFYRCHTTISVKENMPTRRKSTSGARKRLNLRRLIPLIAVLPILFPILYANARRALANDSEQGRVAPYRDGIVLMAFRYGTELAQQEAILSRVGAREIKRIDVGAQFSSRIDHQRPSL
jgi:hypothetical protein